MVSAPRLFFPLNKETNLAYHEVTSSDQGALWQTIAYIFRVISIADPASLGDYAAWFVLILVFYPTLNLGPWRPYCPPTLTALAWHQVAPLWTNAFVYMIVGRMVWNFVPTAKILGITAWRFGLYFVLLDVVYVLPPPYCLSFRELCLPQYITVRSSSKSMEQPLLSRKATVFRRHCKVPPSSSHPMVPLPHRSHGELARYS
jgi:hypothetical protein